MGKVSPHSKCIVLRLLQLKARPTTLVRWTGAEDAELIRLRHQGTSYTDIALAMNKTERAVSQRYLKLVPTNSPKKNKIGLGGRLSEQERVALLVVVARTKRPYWSNVAKEIGGNVSGEQCELEWNEVIRTRGT
jgi:hypothetical protein